MIAESLFPGIVDEWISNGAANVDMVKSFKMQINGWEFPWQQNSNLLLLKGLILPDEEANKPGPTVYICCMTRPFNEFYMRRKLFATCNNVELLSVRHTTTPHSFALADSPLKLFPPKTENIGDGIALQ